jgi:hypothetical protein
MAIEALANILIVIVFLPVALLGVLVLVRFLSLMVAALLDWLKDIR